ncbi:hypothetical protein [Paenibacillus sp. N3.4]|uniref:hypothetical protein n=1 Tax=Paenibacillus sp. N3.4 TaxID=2603222 RepID=UPI001C9C876B|nr:hypothetical protein [Paenibacillus sp. N3.4]
MRMPLLKLKIARLLSKLGGNVNEDDHNSMIKIVIEDYSEIMMAHQELEFQNRYKIIKRKDIIENKENLIRSIGIVH